MAIRFSCSNVACGKRFQVKDELARRRAKCPNCGTIQVVPAQSQADLQPAAAPSSRPVAKAAAAAAQPSAKPAPAYPGADSLALRFMGEGQAEARQYGLPVANKALESPPSLQVLFSQLPRFESLSFTKALRQYHPDMAGGTAEVDPDGAAKGTAYGLIGWGQHVVKFIGFNAPMPQQSVERCVAPAHYGQEQKAQAYAHKGHLILYYNGYVTDPLEQFVALAAVAGMLARAGAVIVCNESASTSLPTQVIAEMGGRPDGMEILRSMPILLLYCGFVKYDVGDGTVWMRTYGAHEFGLPDLSYLASGHNQGEFVFEMFGNTIDYLRTSGARFEAGHTMQLADEFHARLRSPTAAEPFLESDGEMFVLEKIHPNQVNRW
jgi:hypothetical protein